jgi:hypothetical protein
MRKVESFGDPRLYALAVVAEHLSKSTQPLVPAHMFVAGSTGSDGAATGGMLGTLINLLIAEKSGFELSQKNGNEQASLREFADRMGKQLMESMETAATVPPDGNGRS